MLARLLVCERTGQWATALRMATSAPCLRMHEFRSLLDCRRELDRWPRSLLVIEATATNAEGVVRLLAEVQQRFSLVHSIVVGGAEMVPWDALWRECGAALVVDSPRRLDCVWRFAERHVAELPQPAANLRDGVWMRLPWTEG